MTGKTTKPAGTRTKATNASSVSMPAFAPHVEEFLNTTRTVAERQLQSGWDLTSGNVNKVTTHMMNNMNDATNLSKDMYEASMQWCQTWSKGYEEICKGYMGLYQSLSQDYMNAFKSMLSAKTVQEATSLQSEFARQQFDKLMSEGTKMGEICVKVATEAAEPLQTQWSSMSTRYNKAA